MNIVMKFTAAYCPPCRRLDPVVKRLAAEYAERVQVVTVDIEADPATAQKYGVRSVPTLLGCVDGRVVEHQVGYSNDRRVEALFAAVAG